MQRGFCSLLPRVSASALIVALIAAAAVSAEPMETPFLPAPATMRDDERPLDPQTVAHRNDPTHGPDLARRHSESEAVSQSEDRGYVYRYDIAEVVRENGEEHTYRAVFVLWSKDCEGYYIAHYPTYRLPDHLYE